MGTSAPTTPGDPEPDPDHMPMVIGTVVVVCAVATLTVWAILYCRHKQAQRRLADIERRRKELVLAGFDNPLTSSPSSRRNSESIADVVLHVLNQRRKSLDPTVARSGSTPSSPARPRRASCAALPSLAEARRSDERDVISGQPRLFLLPGEGPTWHAAFQRQQQPAPDDLRQGQSAMELPAASHAPLRDGGQRETPESMGYEDTADAGSNRYVLCPGENTSSAPPRSFLHHGLRGHAVSRLSPPAVSTTESDHSAAASEIQKPFSKDKKIADSSICSIATDSNHYVKISCFKPSPGDGFRLPLAKSEQSPATLASLPAGVSTPVANSVRGQQFDDTYDFAPPCSAKNRTSNSNDTYVLPGSNRNSDTGASGGNRTSNSSNDTYVLPGSKRGSDTGSERQHLTAIASGGDWTTSPQRRNDHDTTVALSPDNGTTLYENDAAPTSDHCYTNMTFDDGVDDIYDIVGTLTLDDEPIYESIA